MGVYVAFLKTLAQPVLELSNGLVYRFGKYDVFFCVEINHIANALCTRWLLQP